MEGSQCKGCREKQVQGYRGGVTASKRELNHPAGDVWAPPVRWWVPAIAATALLAVLIAVVVLLVKPPGPLDDPRPAFQRDGLLRDGPVLDGDFEGVELGDRTVILLFERLEPEGGEWQQWQADVTSDGANLVVLTPNDPAHDRLVSALHMPVPVDGGPPIGYAVVDPERRVRYVTLDPQYLINAYEVDVITGAVS